MKTLALGGDFTACRGAIWWCMVLCSNLSPSPLINKNSHLHPERKLLNLEPIVYQHISKMGPGTRYCKVHQAKSVLHLQFQMGWCSPRADWFVYSFWVHPSSAWGGLRIQHSSIDCQRIRSGNPCNSKDKCKLENHFFLRFKFESNVNNRAAASCKAARDCWFHL